MRFQAWSLLAVVALIGCDARTENQSAAPPRTVDVGSGTIRGEVRFGGTPPMLKLVDVTCEHGGQTTIPDGAVIVNANGTLRNVFVYVEGAGLAQSIPQSSVLLDQVHCQYVPHLVGVQIGQTLTVRSSDPILHNVHFLAQRNPGRNLGLPNKGDVPVIFPMTEFIPVKCDVHPWMTAYVGVFENPFFAVTGEDGSFELKGLPPGDYKLVAWHERYGRLEQNVKIGDDKPLAVAFEYKPPAGI